MDVTLLELHVHDPSVGIGTRSPSTQSERDESGAPEDDPTGGSGPLAVVPVVVGLLLVVAIVVRQLRRAMAADELE